MLSGPRCLSTAAGKASAGRTWSLSFWRHRWKSSRSDNQLWDAIPQDGVRLAKSLEKAARGTAEGLASTVKPAFDAHSPFKAALESGRHLANTALRAVDSPIQLETVTEKSSASGVLRDEGDRPHISSWSGTTLVANKDIQAYVDCILQHPDSIVNNPWIPDAVERKIYMLVVKMVLQVVHFACGAIDDRKLFGQTLQIVQSRSSVPLERADLKLSTEMVDSIIRQVMVDSAGQAIITKNVDQLLYHNAVRFALRLVVDMASSLSVTTFGLKFRLQVQTDDTSLLKAEKRSPMDVAALEQLCEPLIRELLADEDINISMIPDHLEEQLYKNILRILVNVAAAAVDNSEVNLFGIQIEPDVL